MRYEWFLNGFKARLSQLNFIRPKSYIWTKIRLWKMSKDSILFAMLFPVLVSVLGKWLRFQIVAK